MIEIEIRQASIATLDVDAIVNPANESLSMGGGVAKVIKEVGGEDIEREAISNAPVNIGDACITHAGDLRARFVIHAPTMEFAAQPSREDDVFAALIAALDCAHQNKFAVIATPGLGTGVGSLPKKRVAKIMVGAIRKYKSDTIQKVVLCDIDPEMVRAWKECL